MTDLLTRQPSHGSRTIPAPAPRSLPVVSAVAGAGAAAGGLLVGMAVAVTGWFLADGGAHGDTRDALRVGADAWLVGHGSHLDFAGVSYTLVPLGLSAALAWVAFRAGRWAGLVAPPTVDRELLTGTGLFASGYVVVSVLTGVVAATSQAAGSLVLVLLGSLVVALGFGGAGIVTGARRWDALGSRLPGWTWPMLRSSLAIVLGFWACSAVAVVVAFGLHLGSAASLVSRLDLSGGDAVMLVLLTALVAPNAVLLGGAYLLGPGFAFGVGTTISPGAVTLGPMPAFPLLAALPDGGPTPWFTTALMVVPAVVAAVAVGLVHRRHPVHAWDLAALRGVGAGITAGFATGIVTGFAGGALGSGRMADIGASTGAVLVAATLSMGLGGLVGALLTTLLQRRAGQELEEAPISATREAAPRGARWDDLDEAGEPTQPIV